MALRDVKPLDDKQWAQVQKMMRDGPTEDSIAVVKNALDRASKMKRTY